MLDYVLTMHGPINVKSPNNTSKWQMGFNSAFKGLSSVGVGGQGHDLVVLLQGKSHGTRSVEIRMGTTADLN
jgi:hypothetical protein